MFLKIVFTALNDTNTHFGKVFFSSSLLIFFFFSFFNSRMSFFLSWNFLFDEKFPKKMEKENTNIWLRWGTIFEKKREIRNQNNQMMMGFFLNFWMRFCLLTEILWFMTWRILGGMKIHLKKFRTKNIISYIFNQVIISFIRN